MTIAATLDIFFNRKTAIPSVKHDLKIEFKMLNSSEVGISESQP